MSGEPTFFKVVDHRDRLGRRGALSGIAVEDSNVIQVTEVSGLHPLVHGLVNFEIRRPGEDEDFAVSPDLQPPLHLTSLPVDARDGETADAGALRVGNHGQIHHGFCESEEISQPWRISRCHAG